MKHCNLSEISGLRPVFIASLLLFLAVRVWGTPAACMSGTPYNSASLPPWTAEDFTLDSVTESSPFFCLQDGSPSGTVTLNSAILPPSSGAHFITVELEADDDQEKCADSRISYEISVDNGGSWIDLSREGNPVSFLDLDIYGKSLKWRASLSPGKYKDGRDCSPCLKMPKILAKTSGPRVFSRSSPVMIGNLLYTGSFMTKVPIGTTPERGAGYLKASRIYNMTPPFAPLATPVMEWDAATKLNARPAGDRKIYFPKGSALEPLEFGNASIDDALLDIDASINRQELIDWTRGKDRDWKLGAIDHSTPAAMTPPSKPDWYFGTNTSTQTRSSFDTFVEAYKERNTVVFVGARDGMLHAFAGGQYRLGDDTTTAFKEKRGYFKSANYGTGEELWAVIPSNLLSRLQNNYWNRMDKAFVDASPTLADVRLNDGSCEIDSDCLTGETCTFEKCTGRGWRTVLLFAQGNGGDTIVCMDVTDPENPRFLWEYSHADLYRSHSSPAVGQVGRLSVDGEEKWGAFFVSGKTAADAYPSIFIINIVDGTLIERIELDAEVSSVPGRGKGGVPSGQPAIVDIDGNGFIDRLYIGTDKGFLYKVNLSDDYLVGHSVMVINQDFYDDDAGATVNGKPNPVPDNQKWQPIYASPTVVVDYGINPDGSKAFKTLIFFGTSDSPYVDEKIDVSNTTYHFFAYLDKSDKGNTDSALVELDWFYPLDTGQRVFAAAFAAAGKIYFGTSTSDTEDPCDGSNLGELYAFDLSGYNASKPAQPSTRIVTGDITSTPVVEDEHLFIRTIEGVKMMGGGNFNNDVKVGGFGKIKPLSWKEIRD